MTPHVHLNQLTEHMAPSMLPFVLGESNTHAGPWLFPNRMADANCPWTRIDRLTAVTFAVHHGTQKQLKRIAPQLT